MKKFAILTDSTCDLPEELAQQHHIDILCFKIALDGEGYTERVDFTPEQFCEMLKHAKGLPTTSQINQFEFFERFEAYNDQEVEEVLYISINRSGSGTHDAALRAADQFAQEHPESSMRIHVVDSHSYSIGEGSGVIEAAKHLENGDTMEEVIAYLEDRYARLEVILTAYSLKVIRKSGRINAASAIAGDLLGIHPIFALIDGVSYVLKKVRGEKAVLTQMALTLKKRMVEGSPYYLSVSDKKYIDDYVNICTEKIGYPPEMIFQLGCAVLSNTGPEAVGLAYVGQKRER